MGELRAPIRAYRANLAMTQLTSSRLRIEKDNVLVDRGMLETYLV